MNANVLLIFENGNPALPFIVGIIHNRIVAQETGNDKIFECDSQQNIIISGRRVEIKGNEEVVLHCDKGSIAINKTGKVVLKGKQITSRASGVNKIKGSTVNIN